VREKVWKVSSLVDCLDGEDRRDEGNRKGRAMLTEIDPKFTVIILNLSQSTPELS